MPTQALGVHTWHKGEQAVQRRAGSYNKMQKIGPKFIRDFLPGEYREFFTELPWVIIGAVDETGFVWASILTGQKGFIESPAVTELVIHAVAEPYDPLVKCLQTGVDVGLLGIMLSNRRRNRVNASVESNLQGRLALSVKQSFGNCPKYIQTRHFLPKAPVGRSPSVETGNLLDNQAMEAIKQADTFFIASHFDDGSRASNTGVDVSHRGGVAGFVVVESETRLLMPDYAGNNFFNTLGNLLLDKRAGLLFIDFKTGDLLYLTGTVEVLWREDEPNSVSKGERMLRFTLLGVRKVTGAFCV